MGQVRALYQIYYQGNTIQNKKNKDKYKDITKPASAKDKTLSEKNSSQEQISGQSYYNILKSDRRENDNNVKPANAAEVVIQGETKEEIHI